MGHFTMRKLALFVFEQEQYGCCTAMAATF